MRKTALIPARLASTRFPAKLMQDLKGKTVIWRTYENTLNSRLFDDVYVVCEEETIYNEIISKGGNAIKSNGIYNCGTDRIAAAALDLPYSDIIVNVQGDEPFIPVIALKEVIQAFEHDPELRVASIMQEMRDQEMITNPNNVKVVIDKNQYALLFSRSVIPFQRNNDFLPTYYKHIGIYAFKRSMLLEFASILATPLETTEQLEGLRYLENGIKMKMILTDERCLGIDTPEDLEIARKMIQNN